MALNNEQLADINETFGMFDKDNDGHITRSECYALLQKLGQSPYDAEETISHMLGQFDRNQSGTIDKQEFIHLMEQQSTGARAGVSVGGNDEARAEFNKYDTNKDGHICRTELTELVKANGAQKSDAEVDGMLKEVDSDSDGRINYKEFAKVME